MRITKHLTLAAVLVFVFARNGLPADLRVTDTSNITVVVHGAVVDYGAFRDDKEDQGIRIQQGEAAVTAQWANIGTLTVTGKDESATPPRIRIELLLRNGQKVSGVLVSRGRMKLLGKTDLGDYSIGLEKIRTIVPVLPDKR